MKYEAIKLRPHRYAVVLVGQTLPVRYVKASSEAEAIRAAFPQSVVPSMASSLLAVL